MVGDGCSNPAQSSAFIRVHPLPSTQFLPQQVNGCAPLMAQQAGSPPVGFERPYVTGDRFVSFDGSAKLATAPAVWSRPSTDLRGVARRES